LHAFGYGVPVVTSNKIRGQNPEIEAFRDNGNGLLYEHGDVDSLTNAVRRILENPDLRQRLCNGALATVTERFTVPYMVDGMESAIRFAYNHRSRR
jgi:glycosyltransferase involved in cell wall biosynthesis